MQHVSVNGLSLSKIVCGTNAFYGRSHFSDARSREYAGRCSDDYIARLVRACTERGVNAVESCANERIHSILQAVQPRVRFIGNTRIDETSGMRSHHQKLDYLLQVQHADVCLAHSQFVDRPRSGGEIKGLKALLEKIHAAGAVAGISTHRVSTVEFCEEHDYPVDLYMFPLNLAGFVYPGYDGHETVEERVKLVRSCSKPFILMKALAAGRIPPSEGLPFVLANCKPNDLVSLGLGSIEEVEESLDIIEGVLAPA